MSTNLVKLQLCENAVGACIAEFYGANPEWHLELVLELGAWDALAADFVRMPVDYNAIELRIADVGYLCYGSELTMDGPTEWRRYWVTRQSAARIAQQLRALGWSLVRSTPGTTLLVPEDDAA